MLSVSENTSAHFARGTADIPVSGETRTQRAGAGMWKGQEPRANTHDGAERGFGSGSADAGVCRLQGRRRCDGLRVTGRDGGLL